MGLRILRPQREIEIYLAAYFMEKDPKAFEEYNIGQDRWEREIIREFKKDYKTDQAGMLIKLMDYIEIIQSF